MDMYPKILENQINELNENLKSLNNSIEKSSDSSNNLQKKLIFWTKVMAIAVGLQAIVIAIQIYLAFK
jgi:subtilase family serine protease